MSLLRDALQAREPTPTASVAHIPPQLPERALSTEGTQENPANRSLRPETRPPTGGTDGGAPAAGPGMPSPRRAFIARPGKMPLRTALLMLLAAMAAVAFGTEAYRAPLGKVAAEPSGPVAAAAPPAAPAVGSTRAAEPEVAPADAPDADAAGRRHREDDRRSARPKPVARQEVTPAQDVPSEPDIVIRHRPRAPEISPILLGAYLALRAGDLDRAVTEYRRALDAEPYGVDALLGLATAQARAGRRDEAAALYRRLLELDPRNALAEAALVVLTGADPLDGESRLKLLLARHPASAELHFALGHVYAAQGRWSEARMAYARARTASPETAEYAYNLGVSLDRLEQPKHAAGHYRRALELTGETSPAFDPAGARRRLDEIGETP